MKQLQSIAMTQAAEMETDAFNTSDDESASINDESPHVPNESYKMTQQIAPPMLQMGTGKSLPELSLAEQKKKSEQKKKIQTTKKPKKTTTKSVTSSTVTSSPVTTSAVTSSAVTSSPETISMLEIGEEKDELRSLINEINIINYIYFY